MSKARRACLHEIIGIELENTSLKIEDLYFIK
jgi:hypothetical protein